MSPAAGDVNHVGFPFQVALLRRTTYHHANSNPKTLPAAMHARYLLSPDSTAKVLPDKLWAGGQIAEDEDTYMKPSPRTMTVPPTALRIVLRRRTARKSGLGGVLDAPSVAPSTCGWPAASVLPREKSAGLRANDCLRRRHR